MDKFFSVIEQHFFVQLIIRYATNNGYDQKKPVHFSKLKYMSLMYPLLLLHIIFIRIEILTTLLC